MMNKLLRVAGVAALVASGSAAHAAVNITVVNSSFETLPEVGLPFGCGTGCSYSEDGGIPGWTTTGATGLFQPGTAGYYNFVPDGLTVAYSNGGSISQTVGSTAVAGVTYTLTTAFGLRNDAADPGTIRLIVGNNSILAAGSVPLQGGWSIYTATYTATAGDAGSAISIVLDSPGVQGGWDNVVLTGSAVPEPGTWALLIAGFGMIGFAARRKVALAA